MVVYVVVTSFLRNVAFLIYALFGEISILEIPVVGNFFTFCRSGLGHGTLSSDSKAPHHVTSPAPGPECGCARPTLAIWKIPEMPSGMG